MLKSTQVTSIVNRTRNWCKSFDMVTKAAHSLTHGSRMHRESNLFVHVLVCSSVHVQSEQSSEHSTKLQCRGTELLKWKRRLNALSARAVGRAEAAVSAIVLVLQYKRRAPTLRCRRGAQQRRASRGTWRTGPRGVHSAHVFTHPSVHPSAHTTATS